MTQYCPGCGKEYEDSLESCPHCSGEPHEQDKKKCPYCAEWIQKDAIRCRYCHEDITVSTIKGRAELPESDRRQQAMYKATFKKVIVIFCIVIIVGVCAGIATFFIIKQVQKGHYQSGWDYLNSGNSKAALEEFNKAGSYSDASEMRELTVMYMDAADAMNQRNWEAAYSEIQRIEEVREGFLDVPEMIAFLKATPGNPSTFSLSEIQSSVSIANVQMNNLIGETISSVGFARGWNYGNHGRPDLISSISILPGLEESAIIAAFDSSKLRKEGVLFIVASPGAEFDLPGFIYNYHFRILDASIVRRPTGFSDINYGYDPVFGSLTIEITAILK